MAAAATTTGAAEKWAKAAEARAEQAAWEAVATPIRSNGGNAAWAEEAAAEAQARAATFERPWRPVAAAPFLPLR
jgi:hypothetical protein